MKKREKRVRGEYIYWDFSAINNDELKFLPRMETDITLENKESKIIIDAKFYQKTLTKNFDKEKIS